MQNKPIKVVGAGLAGCEAAWQIAKFGIPVELIDIKPHSFTPAHHSEDLAELVCSNSLRAAGMHNAVGVLKEELRKMGSLIMEAADTYAVPAGGALAVDRMQFSRYITEKIKGNELITYVSKEVTEIPDDEYCIIASGPLTLDALAQDIRKKYGDNISFFDAAAPIVEFDSIDMNKAFFASRYGKGSADYINCPMNKEEYLAFRNELINAECAELKGFENSKVFEGCMPIEVMASRGEDTMRYGPLKPVGLDNAQTGEKYYAVIQLRQDDSAGTLYNIVGFQTHLKFPEQKRVFSMIPGLENAVFARYGVMHRNSFLNSPKLLNEFYEMRSRKGLYFAGQITGVEGYLESTSSGFVAGINAARSYLGLAPFDFTAQTAIGSLCHYVSNESIEDFQPMNVNFGLFSDINVKVRKRAEKRLELAQRAVDYIDEIKDKIRGDIE